MRFVHFWYLQGAGMLYVHINSNGDTDMNTFIHIIKNTPIATILGGFLIGIAFVAIWTAAWVVLP